MLLAGAGALLFLSAGKKKRRTKSAPEEDSGKSEENLDKESGSVFDTEEDEWSNGSEEPQEEEEAPLISKYMDPNGRAQLGALYQIKPGDTPLEICREALFGSREPVMSKPMRQAAMDLLVRIDCGPWNQTNYGVGLAKLTAGHAQIDQYWTQKGVSFDPIYSNNLKRMSEGRAPSGAEGGHFALIWIPMINLDRFDMEGVVTTEGMYHQDSSNGRGGSMIDPPEEILELGFDDVIEKTVGCDLPEGDFRRTVVAS